MGKIINPKRIEWVPLREYNLNKVLEDMRECPTLGSGLQGDGTICQVAKARVGLANSRRNVKDRAAEEDYAATLIQA